MSAPLDLDVSLLRDHALEDLSEGRVVDHLLHASALCEPDELVLDALLQLRVRELDPAEALPRLRREDLPHDLLPLRHGLMLDLLELHELPAADRLELRIVDSHLTTSRRTSRARGSISPGPGGSRGTGGRGASGPVR